MRRWRIRYQERTNDPERRSAHMEKLFATDHLYSPLFQRIVLVRRVPAPAAA